MQQRPVQRRGQLLEHRPEQLTENLGAIAVARRLTPQHIAAIEAIAESKPDAYGGYGGAGMRDINTL